MTSKTLAQQWAHFYFAQELMCLTGINWQRKLRESSLNLEDEPFLRVNDANTDDCVALRVDAIEFGQLMEQVIRNEPRHANCEGLNSPGFFSDSSISTMYPEDVVADRGWVNTFKALKHPKKMVGYLSFESCNWNDAIKMAFLFEKHSNF